MSRSLIWRAVGASYSSSSLTSERHLMGRYPMQHWSSASSSSSAPPVDLPKDRKGINQQVSSRSHSDHKQDVKNIVSYRDITPTKVTKEDGSAWRWNCFRPRENYRSDVSIDVTKHHKPENYMGKFAYRTVQALKFPTHLFFQRRHMCHAMLLETVAAVPGMVGGMLLHCKSLREFEQSGGWIKALLEEAENERMHLMHS